MTLLPRGNYDLPRTSEEGDIKLSEKNIDLEFIKDPGMRKLKFDYPDFGDEKGLKADLELRQNPDHDSIVIASDWRENPKQFYYNQKINCLPTEGKVKIGENTYHFEEDTSFGVLDWGRGVWGYENTWYWGSASTRIEGTPIGWNLGYGFSDRSHATENAIFYDGEIHKLDKITFRYDENDYLKPWKITSNENRFEMEFKPIMDRNSEINMFLLKSVQHQVFGNYSGYFVLDDGEKIRVENVLGFAEEVYNRW